MKEVHYRVITLYVERELSAYEDVESFQKLLNQTASDGYKLHSWQYRPAHRDILAVFALEEE